MTAAQKSPVRGPDGRYTRGTVRYLDRDWPFDDVASIGVDLARELAERGVVSESKPDGQPGEEKSDGC